FYVENFLKFPIRSESAVPVGFYDGVSGNWIPSTTGHMLRITSKAGGKAAVTVGGTSPSFAGPLTLDDDELTMLATLYAVGDELWRVSVTHFSKWDCNFPWHLPTGAGPPDGPPPPR